MNKDASHRIDELDYIKCILILLMVSFHLVYIGDLYPYAKQVVYTFHMPLFLLLSGYLMKVDKTAKKFLYTIKWYLIPYVVMESGYVWMASGLPIREHIDHLSLSLYFDMLLFHPLGPYWYLHTLILCGMTYYGVYHLLSVRLFSRFIQLGIIYSLYAQLGLVSLGMSFYFLAGAVIRHSKIPLLQFFQPSWLALLALPLLIAHQENLHVSASGGILISYLFVSVCLASYPMDNDRLLRCMLYLGRNTMSIYIFSPIFTFPCKYLLPLFAFDTSGLLFLVVSLAVCVFGSLSIKWIMDIFHVSPILFRQ
jgi:fucose 4-O-acetylase-like acetyltransferase